MNIAIIFAGGTGQRMNSRTMPKQFLELHSKPIIAYTVENFQNHQDIDGIIIICLEDWIGYCEQIVQKYCFDKVRAVIPGGETGQDSIYNGLAKAEQIYPADSVVLIHDGVRPLVDEETISKCIYCVQQHGSAITVSPAVETIAIKNKDGEVGEIISRDLCLMAKAPQCFYLKNILDAHRKANREGLDPFIDSASIMRWANYPLYTVECSSENIKITTPSDFYIFRAMIDARENSQIFGV